MPLCLSARVPTCLQVLLLFSSHGDLNRGGGKSSSFGMAGTYKSKATIKNELFLPFCKSPSSRLLAVWSACFSGGLVSSIYIDGGTKKVNKSNKVTFDGLYKDEAALQAWTEKMAEVTLKMSPTPAAGWGAGATPDFAGPP